MIFASKNNFSPVFTGEKLPQIFFIHTRCLVWIKKIFPAKMPPWKVLDSISLERFLTFSQAGLFCARFADRVWIKKMSVSLPVFRTVFWGLGWFFFDFPTIVSQPVR